MRNIKKKRELVTVIFQKAGNHCYSKGNIGVLTLRSSRPPIQPFINSIYIRHTLFANNVPNKCPRGIYSSVVKTDIKPRNEQKRVSMRVARASASLLSSHGRVPGTSPG